MKRLLYVIIFILLHSFIFCDYTENIRLGKSYYIEKDYETALEYYDKAFAEKPFEKLGEFIKKLRAYVENQTVESQPGNKKVIEPESIPTKTAINNINQIEPIQTVGNKNDNWWKMLTGIVLAGLGTYVVYDGFHDVDRSEPGLRVEEYVLDGYYLYDGYYYGEVAGTVKNTGNVDLVYTNIKVTFKNDLGNEILTTSNYIVNKGSNLRQGESDVFLVNTLELRQYPAYVTIAYEAEYEKYMEANNVFEGVAGIASICLGSYFLMDYFFDFENLFKKDDITIKASAFTGNTIIMAYKEF